ncbi:hypothetical protein F2Q70_00036760 [Brassica cretica]|uniref:Uncharacterized protein n=1 Tax=Brassica cretica TaxID=69181 RepID=A0A8S9JVT5_BRACR|nr:hypothetical protein F2Q70_00036760 [Brassica cretica]
MKNHRRLKPLSFRLASIRAESRDGISVMVVTLLRSVSRKDDLRNVFAFGVFSSGLSGLEAHLLGCFLGVVVLWCLSRNHYSPLFRPDEIGLLVNMPIVLQKLQGSCHFSISQS